MFAALQSQAYGISAMLAGDRVVMAIRACPVSPGNGSTAATICESRV
jgi:hypothetical protein